MIKNIISLILISVVVLGCEPNGILASETDNRVIDVYCDNCTTDEDGNIYYTYQGFNYGTIDFSVLNVDTHTLVGWTSPDQYCVDHLGNEICEPIINYQTYSDEDGYGQQNFYMNDTFIGHTLRLIGYLSPDNYDEIYITIK